MEGEMSIKENFGNVGLYRLWVVLFWVWVAGFLFLGGAGETKKAYRSYIEQQYCEEVQKTPFCFFRGDEAKRAQVSHNPLVLLLLVLLALFGPPFAVYYCYRIARWIGVGFRGEVDYD